MPGIPPLLTFEEVLSNTPHGEFHILVADVIKSFETVDRDILDCALGRLGLAAWFRRGEVLLRCRLD